MRHDSHSVEVWHVDLVEWEQRGSAAEACADVLLDKRWPDLIRRKAMLARLTALPRAGAPLLSALAELAQAQGIALRELHLESGRLDEVFRTITA